MDLRTDLTCRILNVRRSLHALRLVEMTRSFYENRLVEQLSTVHFQLSTHFVGAFPKYFT